MAALKPKFLKPGEKCIWEEDKSDIEVSNGTRFVYNAHLSLGIENQRQRLPIFQRREHILYLLENHQTLVLVGETGCGKSTQVPQYLAESGWCEENKMVGVSEPRRVAATTLANRVAEEKACFLGEEVGYSIRFDDCSGPNTKIKFMTEGILIREMMSDPLLRKYSVIMLDEVHERTLLTDIVMGLLKKILRKQKKLRLIVASATVDAEHLRGFFNQKSGAGMKSKDTAVIMSVEGRLYPVDIHYLKEPTADYVLGVVDTVLKIHKYEAPGDILAFLTGQDEVDAAVSLISQQIDDTIKSSLSMIVLPMYGSLPNADQLKVFHSTPRGTRKVVIATNIAEASVTIPGIVYVVDCGFVKLRWYNVKSECDALVVVPTSQAAAEQRAGRAGRVKPGKVFRLYTESEFSTLHCDTPPEMQRSELSGAVLQLKALGIDNVLRFAFPSPPPAQSLATALQLLHALGAISSEGQLTRPHGLNMAELPLSPLHAATLIASGENGCSEEMASIVSLLQVASVFIIPGGGAAAIKARAERRKFEATQGDLLTLLNVYTAFSLNGQSKAWCHKHFFNYRSLTRVMHIRKQMIALLLKLNVPLVSCKGDGEKVCYSIAAGFFPNAAYLHHSGVYRTVRGHQDLDIHPTSVLYSLQQPQWVLYCEIVNTNRAYMRELTVVNPKWLEEIAPHFYQKTTERDH